jgi:hypothetical protein
VPGFVEAQHPRGPGGKFRTSLASRAKKYRQAGAAKLAAFRVQEAARVRTKLQAHDAETAQLVAGAGDKAGKIQAARDNRRKAIEAHSATRLDEARKRVRASVRYEHELGKLRGQPFDVQDRAWNRWRKRKAGERVRGNDALKAAIARAQAAGPRKVDVHQDHLTGRTVSKRSKTGNPACSAAMSAWKLGRGTPAVHAMLAKCRAQAAGRRQATLARAGGNEARAQHLEHRSKQGMTGKERLVKAKELAEKRRAGKAPTAAPQAETQAKPKAARMTPDQRKAAAKLVHMIREGNPDAIRGAARMVATQPREAQPAAIRRALGRKVAQARSVIASPPPIQGGSDKQIQYAAAVRKRRIDQEMQPARLEGPIHGIHSAIDINRRAGRGNEFDDASRLSLRRKVGEIMRKTRAARYEGLIRAGRAASASSARQILG